MTTPGGIPSEEPDTADKPGAEIGMVEGDGSTFEPEEDTPDAEDE